MNSINPILNDFNEIRYKDFDEYIHKIESKIDWWSAPDDLYIVSFLFRTPFGPISQKNTFKTPKDFERAVYRQDPEVNMAEVRKLFKIDDFERLQNKDFMKSPENRIYKLSVMEQLNPVETVRKILRRIGETQNSKSDSTPFLVIQFDDNPNDVLVKPYNDFLAHPEKIDSFTKLLTPEEDGFGSDGNTNISFNNVKAIGVVTDGSEKEITDKILKPKNLRKTSDESDVVSDSEFKWASVSEDDEMELGKLSGGAFFPYSLKLNARYFALLSYRLGVFYYDSDGKIFPEIPKGQVLEHCLVYATRMYFETHPTTDPNELSTRESILKQMSELIYKNKTIETIKHLTFKEVGYLGSQVGIHFKIYCKKSQKNSSYCYRDYGASKPLYTIKIGYLANHYFLNEPMNLSKEGFFAFPNKVPYTDSQRLSGYAFIKLLANNNKLVRLTRDMIAVNKLRLHIKDFNRDVLVDRKTIKNCIRKCNYGDKSLSKQNPLDNSVDEDLPEEWTELFQNNSEGNVFEDSEDNPFEDREDNLFGDSEDNHFEDSEDNPFEEREDNLFEEPEDNPFEDSCDNPVEDLSLDELAEKYGESSNDVDEDLSLEELAAKYGEELKVVDTETVYFGDFETCVNCDNELVPMMLCLSDFEGKLQKTFVGLDCINQFFQFLQDGNKYIVYFHNLSFDGRLIMAKVPKCSNDSIIKGNKFIKLVIPVGKATLELRDSLSLYPMALATFPKSFPAAFPDKIEKELFPYSYYNYERVLNNSFKLEEAVASGIKYEHWKEDDVEHFKNNVKKVCGDNFDGMKYCEFYCKRDVDILREGFKAYRKAFLNKPLEIDILNFTTLPSISSYWLKREVFTKCNCDKYGGQLAAYMRNFIKGGRCMTRDNKAWCVTEPLLDLDNNSLYPAAMSRMFIPLGIPEKLDSSYSFKKIYNGIMSENEDVATKEHFIAYGLFTVRVESVNESHFSHLSHENEQGIKVYECKPGIYYLDLLELEDVAKFYGAKMTLLDGYIWQGKPGEKCRDLSIRDKIKELYNARLKYKSEGNPMELCVKLLLNSMYGKSIQKDMLTTTEFVEAKNFKKYLRTRLNSIVEMTVLQSGLGIAKVANNISKDYNFLTFGIIVLSMSKRIMNEAMCLAEHLNIPMYYQDTDSIHILKADVPKLAKAYKKNFNRELLGDGLGQFKNDFKMKDAYTKLHISLGKKMYLDVITNGDDTDYHVRMKGIPLKTIQAFCKERYGCEDYEKLYRELLDGAEFEFNLATNRTQLDLRKDCRIFSKSVFLRKVKRTCEKAEI